MRGHPLRISMGDHQPEERLNVEERGIQDSLLILVSLEVPVNRPRVLVSHVLADMGDVEPARLRCSLHYSLHD